MVTTPRLQVRAEAIVIQDRTQERRLIGPWATLLHNLYMGRAVIEERACGSSLVVARPIVDAIRLRGMRPQRSRPSLRISITGAAGQTALRTQTCYFR